MRPIDAEGPRARVDMQRDAHEAERRAEALHAAGIDARVEIDDTQRALPGQSLIPGVPAMPGENLFAFPVTVPTADRARATRLLEDLDGVEDSHLSGGTLGRGVAVALGLGALALALRVAVG